MRKNDLIAISPLLERYFSATDADSAPIPGRFSRIHADCFASAQ